jgi:hypothetical protein
MSNEYNFRINQGEDFTLQVELRDENNDPIDLTGHVFSGQMRNTASSDDIAASFSFNILDQITDTGKVEILLAASVSSAMTLPSSPNAKRKLALFAYDIESVSSGTTSRWLEGIVSMSPEVTK